MRRKFLETIALLSFIVCLISGSAWAVPSLINYQGKLTNISDCILTGTYHAQFLLYDAATGGTALWDEVQNVSVDNGLFTVHLGAVASFPIGLFENDSLYLETVIHNPDTGLWEVLSPRQQFTSTAYAMKADHAATAGIATDAGHAVTADSAVNATNADTATNATSADHAVLSDSATNATNAITADDADTVDGKHAEEFLDTSSETQTKTGGLNISGNVGIGTTSPSEKFEVAGKLKLTGASNGIVFPDGSLQTTAAGTPSPPTGTKYSGSLAPGQSFSFNLYNTVGGMLSIAHSYQAHPGCIYGGVSLYLVFADVWGCWGGERALIKSIDKGSALEISFPWYQVSIKNTSSSTVQYIIIWFGSFNLW